jgi:hypothetical protein
VRGRQPDFKPPDIPRTKTIAARIGAQKFDDENRSGFGSVSRRWILPPPAMPRLPNRAIAGNAPGT